MTATHDLLFEIGTEELPPTALRPLSEALGAEIAAGLAEARIAHGATTLYATPRRLAAWVRAAAVAQPAQETLRRGPALAAACDDEGRPTPAALGFARSCGVAVEALERDDSGGRLLFRQRRAGQATMALLPALLQRALDRLPIPRRMRWGDSDAEFLRPVHWLLIRFGDEIVPARMYGVESGGATRGHRFHAPEEIVVPDAAHYAELLEREGRVLPTFAARRARIRAQAEGEAAARGGVALIDDALLDEVTALVEWPVALSGRFEKRFLQLPREALIATMQGHQKFFPVVDGDGKLLPSFIAVANIESRDPEQVRSGFERVIRPRLADAMFFWEQDKKRPLSEQREALKQVVYQKALGSLYDKSERLERLAMRIAAKMPKSAWEPLKYLDSWSHHWRVKDQKSDTVWGDIEDGVIGQSARLCKCDLLTHMVQELPELQGTMGHHYAIHDGEPVEVAEAIRQHYLPRFAGDALPESPVGQALALADRFDTLAGLFALGKIPTGTKDPFGLRRAALGVVRICVEKELPLDVAELFYLALKEYRDAFGKDFFSPEAIQTAMESGRHFLQERMRGYFLDQGIESNLFEAVAHNFSTSLKPLEFARRAAAVQTFLKLSEATNLIAANKRIRNILEKSDEKPVDDLLNPTNDLLQEPAEKELWRRAQAVAPRVEQAIQKGDYAAALTAMAALRDPVDAFFDQVMVMTEDVNVRRNRLTLLRHLRKVFFLRVADLSRL